MPALLDTNVIIRYITQDEPQQSARVRSFLDRVEAGLEEALLTEGVIVEAVQVLSSKVLYHLSRQQVADDLSTIIGLRGMRLPGRARYLRALDLYASAPRLDFVDALLVAYAEQQAPHTIISYDQDFDRVAGITRREPPPLRAEQS
jgi:predicted nucleic acid-binding protein